jgi:hypothetical protein
VLPWGVGIWEGRGKKLFLSVLICTELIICTGRFSKSAQKDSCKMHRKIFETAHLGELRGGEVWVRSVHVTSHVMSRRVFLLVEAALIAALIHFISFYIFIFIFMFMFIFYLFYFIFLYVIIMTFMILV